MAITPIGLTRVAKLASVLAENSDEIIAECRRYAAEADRLQSEVEDLKDRIDNAHSYACETAPNMRTRLIRIMGALGLDFGDESDEDDVEVARDEGFDEGIREAARWHDIQAAHLERIAKDPRRAHLAQGDREAAARERTSASHIRALAKKNPKHSVDTVVVPALGQTGGKAAQ